jgi:hypothetical protein
VRDAVGVGEIGERDRPRRGGDGAVATSPMRKFIAGDPMKPATNRFCGRS